MNKNKIIANLLLVLVLTMCFLSAYFEPAYPWLAWVKSFSEAASVGAIADWFAVTALFRHPFGLPIPHTAIIAKQRDKLAMRLGEFIDKNFLSGDVLRRKIVDENISFVLVEWLSKESNAGKVSSLLKQLAIRSLFLFEDKAFFNLLNKDLKSVVNDVPITPFLARSLKHVMESDSEQELLSGTLSLLEKFLESNSKAIENFVSDKVPWYVPRFIHEATFNQFLRRLRDDVKEIEGDLNHPARQKFQQQILRFSEELQSDPDLKMKIERLKNIFINSPVVEQYVLGFVQKAITEARTQLAEQHSPLSKIIDKGAATFVQQIKKDTELQNALNLWLFDVISNLTNHSSVNFAYLVKEVISSWKTETLVARIEEQVSSDMQFIRINGTVIGGLAGLVLHFISEYFFP